MSKIAIITDTDSSLPLEITNAKGITQVPIIIQFGDESFRDGYDISNETVFARIDKEGKLTHNRSPLARSICGSF